MRKTPPWVTDADGVAVVIERALEAVQEFEAAVTENVSDWPGPHNQCRDRIQAAMSTFAGWHNRTRQVVQPGSRPAEMRRWLLVHAGFDYMIKTLDHSYVTTSLYLDDDLLPMAVEQTKFAEALWPLAADSVQVGLIGEKRLIVEAFEPVTKDLLARRAQLQEFIDEWADRANEVRRAAIPPGWAGPT